MAIVLRPHLKLASLFAVSVIALPTFVAAEQVRLPLTPHHQEHALSCEVATLKIALGVHNITVSENELIAHLPFDPTPKSSGVWGDPNQGFVGNINGRMLGNGYGVYWDPIAKLGQAYAPTRVLRNSSASEVARELQASNPIIVWGYSGQRQVFDWHTPAGIPIKAVNGEHTRVVYGYDGTVTHPTQFYLYDPSSGYLAWTTEKFMDNWSSLNHMGVVVMPPVTWVRVPGSREVWEIDTSHQTRRWITTWETFTQRGGTTAAIKSIAAATLRTYTLGSPIK